MGVPSFYRWLSARYPKTVKDIIEETEVLVDGNFVPADPSLPNPNGEFDCLYLDMNAIIHPCSHPPDCDQPETEGVMFEYVFKYIERIINVIRPRKLLYMAIDGVAPRAKMNQQRLRRFRAAYEIEKEEEIYEELKTEFLREGRPVPPPKIHWDSNVITPGTPFMDDLTTALRWWTQYKIATEPAWRDLKVILTDSNSPGEGEHKILQFIRDARHSSTFDPNTKHVIYGGDADLIMLGLASHEAHMYIVREEVVTEREKANKCPKCGQIGHSAVDCKKRHLEDSPQQGMSSFEKQFLGFKSTWLPLQVIQIPVLRQYLGIEFAFEETPLPFKYDLERCLDDFVFMCFFCGNDFLPHLPSMSIKNGSIDMMIALYKKILPKMDDFLTDAGSILWPQVTTFIAFIALTEPSYFKMKKENDERAKARRQRMEENAEHVRNMAAANSNAATSTLSMDANNEAARVLRNRFNSGSGGRHTDKRQRGSEGPIEIPIPNAHQENTDLWKERFSSRMKVFTELKDPTDDVQLGVGDPKEYRTRYYQKKFHLEKQDDADDFSRIVGREFAIGMQWVLTYYYQGVCSWSWYYPYHYAPLASDIVVALNGSGEPPSLRDNALISKSDFECPPFDMSEPFCPFNQLMAVLPPRSGFCLPKTYQALMNNVNSTIADFYPRTFKSDPDGKPFSWLWVVLLPFIDAGRLLRAVDPLDFTLTDKERYRNSRGKELCFLWSSSKDLALLSEAENGKVDFPHLRGSMQHSAEPLVAIEENPHSSLVCPITDGDNSVDRAVKSSSVCLVYSRPQKKPHVCQLPPGAEPPLLDDLKESDIVDSGKPSDERRVNMNVAACQRFVMAALGSKGFKIEVESQNNRGRMYPHTPNQPGMRQVSAPAELTGRGRSQRPPSHEVHAGFERSGPPADYRGERCHESQHYSQEFIPLGQSPRPNQRSYSTPRYQYNDPHLHGRWQQPTYGGPPPRQIYYHDMGGIPPRYPPSMAGPPHLPSPGQRQVYHDDPHRGGMPPSTGGYGSVDPQFGRGGNHHGGFVYHQPYTQAPPSDRRGYQQSEYPRRDRHY